MKLEKQLMQFGFDVSALPNYTDEQSTDFFLTLLENSTFLSKLPIREGVKGDTAMQILDMDVTLQEVSGCTLTPDGAVIFSQSIHNPKRLGMAIEFCNETLNTKYTRILNSLGVSRQDETVVLEDVLLAYMGNLLKRKAQRLIILGDTASVDPELAIMDGIVKRFDADAAMTEVTTTATTIDETNAYDIAIELYEGILPKVLDAGTPIEILTGRAEARAILNQIYNDKDFNALTVDKTEEGGTLSFILPTTDIRVTTLPELNGLEKMYAFAYDFTELGVDLESDMDNLEIKYDDYNNKLKIEANFRLSFQYAISENFTKLTLSV